MTQLSALWSAKSIAVIGATERAGAMGRAPIEYLQRYGYKGEIYPVNPKGGTILGLTAYTSVTDIKSKVELALIMVPAALVEESLKQCGIAGVGVVIVMSSGFAEADEAGAQAQARLFEIAQQYKMRMVGPNCIGAVGGGQGLVASFSPVFAGASTQVAAGSVALVSQSGALGYGMYSLGMDAGLPIGAVVTTGNEADVTALEVARELADDSTISSILLYTESLADIDALTEISSKKPTAILKVGRSAAGALAAASHTGALATEDRVIDAAINSTSAVRVDDVEELIDAGLIFAAGAKPLGKRIAIITTSGGSGILATDAIEKSGQEMASFSQATLDELATIVPSYGNITNPVDVTAAVMSSPDLFERCLEVLAKDPGVDAIVACFAVLVGNDVERIAKALGEVRNIRNVPIAVARTGSSALAPDKSGLPIPSANATEVELKELWKSVGIPVPLSVVVNDEAAALKAIAEVGGRAVFKAVIPGLLHKSEAGGVALDITAETGRATYKRLSQLAGDGKSNEVLVETFVPKGVEALVGVTSSSLGKVLTIGVGGILTEIISDVAIRLLPVNETIVREMISQTRLAPLFAGARGSAPADVESFVKAVLRIAEVAEGWPAGSELDMNPITVLPNGAWVLDSAYSLSGATNEGTSH
jgi:acetate---CoA ligase (ADP-forming)